MKKSNLPLFGRLTASALAAMLSILPAMASAAPQEIRIAVPDISVGSKPAGGGVADVLRAQRLLEEEFAADGIKIHWGFYKGAGPVINEALANGQVDFAYLGDLAAIVGKANGLDTRLLSAITRNGKVYLGTVPGSGITTLDDLKDKRVAIFRGTALQLSFADALASQGLKERDLKIINLDFSAASSALAARQIDATWGFSNLIALRDRGLAELPLNSQDLDGAGSLQGVLVGDGRFVDANPELLTRFLHAHLRAVEWLRDERNKPAYLELLAQQSGLPIKLLQADQGDNDFHETFDPRLDAAFLQRLQQGVDLAASERLIRKGFNVQEWAAASRLPEVPAPLGQ